MSFAARVGDPTISRIDLHTFSTRGDAAFGRFALRGVAAILFFLGHTTIALQHTFSHIGAKTTGAAVFIEYGNAGRCVFFEATQPLAFAVFGATTRLFCVGRAASTDAEQTPTHEKAQKHAIRCETLTALLICWFCQLILCHESEPVSVCVVWMLELYLFVSCVV